MSLVFVFLLCSVSCQGQSVAYTPLYSRCFNTVVDNIIGGAPCLNVSNARCFDVKIDLSLGRTPVFSRALPIPMILSGLQLATAIGQNSACVPLEDPLGLLKNLNCNACLNITSYNFNPSGSLHMCSTARLSCDGPSALTKFSRDFTDIPCVDINDCQFLDCPSECNGHGKCNALGICACSNSYHGYDCSIQVSGSCAKQGATEECWDVSTKLDSTCSATFTVGQKSRTVPLAKIANARIPLTPCTTSATVSPFHVAGDSSGLCEYCVSLSNFTYDKRSGKLTGCKTVDTICAKSLLSSSLISCSTLLENVNCDDRPAPPQPPQPKDQPGAGPTEPGVGEPQPPTETVPEGNIWFIVGIGACVLILSAVIAVAVYYYRKKQNPHANGPSIASNETVPFSESMGSSSVELSDSS